MAPRNLDNGSSTFHLTPIDPPTKQKAPVDHHMVKKRASLSVPVEPGLPSLQNALKTDSQITFAKPIVEAEAEGDENEDARIDPVTADTSNDDNSESGNCALNDGEDRISRTHNKDRSCYTANRKALESTCLGTGEFNDTGVNDAGSSLNGHDILNKVNGHHGAVFLSDIISSETQYRGSSSGISGLKRKRGRHIGQEQETGIEDSLFIPDTSSPPPERPQTRKTRGRKVAEDAAVLLNRQMESSMRAISPECFDMDLDITLASGNHIPLSGKLLSKEITQTHTAIGETIPKTQSVPNLVNR